MAFKSYENTGASTCMKEGDYEVMLMQCGETTTRTSGQPTIAFDFKVRDDVEQPYKGKHIFKNFYRDRETNEWPVEKIGRFANALGIEKGADFELDDLVGRCCILHMKPFVGQDGVERDSIYYAESTKVGQAIGGAAPAGAQGFTEVEDDELPF